MSRFELYYQIIQEEYTKLTGRELHSSWMEPVQMVGMYDSPRDMVLYVIRNEEQGYTAKDWVEWIKKIKG